LQRLRDSANAALSQVEPVMLVLASVVTWIVLSTTSSILSGAYISVSEKGTISGCHFITGGGGVSHVCSSLHCGITRADVSVLCTVFISPILVRIEVLFSCDFCIFAGLIGTISGLVIKVIK